MAGKLALFFPPTGWQPGDIVMQVHRLQVGEASPQQVFIEIGVYRHKVGRLPVLLDGEAVGDRVLLEPISVD